MCLGGNTIVYLIKMTGGVKKHEVKAEVERRSRLGLGTVDDHKNDRGVKTEEVLQYINPLSRSCKYNFTKTLDEESESSYENSKEVQKRTELLSK